MHGNAGADLLEGGTGDDHLHGDAGDDLLIGGTGADRLEGDAGNDTYVFKKGDGEDIIDNYDTTSAAVDTIRFEDVAKGELTGVFRDGSDLILAYGDTDKLTIDNFYLSASYQVDRFAFTDGVLSTAEFFTHYSVQLSSGIDILTFTALDERIDGLAGNDTLYGGAGNDALYGNLGNDTLHGGDGNDTLEGGEGNDTLYGEAGDDILHGGLGNDRLEGGKGNDEYRFERGEGQDVIYDYDTTKDNADHLVFGPDIAADQLWFRKSGSNLEISVIGTTDKVTLNNWYTGSSGAYRVESFRTNDAILTEAHVQTLVDAMAGYAQPQTVELSDTGYADLIQMIGFAWENI